METPEIQSLIEACNLKQQQQKDEPKEQHSATEKDREFDIFISYRRSDSAYATGHIFDSFKRDHPNIKVFKDDIAIRYGRNFEVEIDEAIRSCRIVLAVIGPTWANCKQGLRKRLFQKDDHLRLEIETAFKRKLPVVPVLIGAADIPNASQLPKTLQELRTAHGLKVRPYPDLHADIAQLVEGLQHELA